MEIFCLLFIWLIAETAISTLLQLVLLVKLSRLKPVLILLSSLAAREAVKVSVFQYDSQCSRFLIITVKRDKDEGPDKRQRWGKKMSKGGLNNCVQWLIAGLCFQTELLGVL